MFRNNIALAKALLPLPDLMWRVGDGDRAKKSARCPFHDDRNPSFSVFRAPSGAWKWKCHASCGNGDEINYLMTKKGMYQSEAIKLYFSMAGVSAAKPLEMQWKSGKAVFL